MKTLAAVLACTFLAAGCMRHTPPPREPWPPRAAGASVAKNIDDGCVSDYRPGVDYFPQKTAFRHSTQLQVTYAPHYKQVRFTPNVATGETLEFLLVQCGTPVPAHGPHTQVIRIPVQRMVTGNSAMLRALDELGLVDRLYGAENTRAASVPSVRERVARGLVQDMWGYGHASIEPVMAVEADVYFSFYSAYPQGNMHPRLWELGVRAVPQADHHETHPLGRAEWLKLLALLTNREAQAEAHFSEIESAYRRLAALVADVKHRPLVMAGFAAGRDTFETFGGRNHRAQLIRDAGGRYVLDADQNAASLLYLPFEALYTRAAGATHWIGSMGGQASVANLIAANALHGWFRAAREGRVYAWDRGYSGAWTYPYQDQSMTLPHVLLAEAITVLHPELSDAVLSSGAAEPRFLRKLP